MLDCLSEWRAIIDALQNYVCVSVKRNMKYVPLFVIYASLQTAAITAKFLIHVRFVVGLVQVLCP
jgi:hypothetical protein